MGYSYDATNVKPDMGYPIIDTSGWYPFRVIVATPGTSKKSGAYQVTVDAACLDPRWKDYTVRHWVTFLKEGAKGAGMAIHWLKCIGEPYEGKLDVEPLSWERKTFMGKVSINEYKADDGSIKRNNKFDEISPIRDTEDIPFGEPTPSQKTAFDE